MKTKTGLMTIISLIFSFQISSAQNRLYLWTEPDPGWKSKAVNFWKGANGYGKKVPQEMIRDIGISFETIRKDFDIRLTDQLFRAGNFSQIVRPENPTSIVLQPSDIFVDLQYNIIEISEKYPFFRKEIIGADPCIRYYLQVYGAKGEIIMTREYKDPVNFKEHIRNKVKDIPEYKRDLEIVSLSHEFSFGGSTLDSLVLLIGKAKPVVQANNIQADPARFHTVVSLLFEKRKAAYPEQYASMTILPGIQVPSGSYEQETNDTEDVPTLTETSDRNVGNTKYGNELTELLRNGKYYALIIGINEYFDPDVSDLTNPINDATKLRDLLLNNYSFDKDNIIFLKDATRKEIIQKFDYLSGIVTSNDNLLIFYAGHGLWDEQMKKGYWFPADAYHDNRSNWFSNSDLRDYVGGITSRHTLLISDACFSGGIFKTREVNTGATQAAVELYKLPSRKAMTSGAMTAVPDKSVFIEYFLKRLAENKQACISAEQLFASFKIAVINNSATNQVPQFGEIRETGDEGGDFLFIRKY
jgi:hypothetical protein